MRKSAMLIVCTLSALLAGAQTVFYVDGTRPNNTGNGLSWATAKKISRMPLPSPAVAQRYGLKPALIIPMKEQALPVMTEPALSL